MNERTSIMGRMFLLLGLLFLLPFAILLQIFRVNVVEGEGLRELWSSQAIDYISIPAQRGNIYDANGSLLATNSIIYKVAVDPLAPGTTRDDLQRVSTVLSEHTNRTGTFYLNKIGNASSRSRYIVLERSVNVQAYEDLKALGIRGVILEEEYSRNYNFGSLSAHVIGFVNHNIDGMAGLESQYNRVLKGEEGIQQVRKDRNNRIFAYIGAPQKQPQQGYSLHTTIDAFIQAIAEEELAAGVKKHQANQGTAIVMNPKTGKIKAMANYPTYNPNSPATIDEENRRNYAVADMIEPGSTFKLVTSIAALETNAVSLTEEFVTPESGHIMIHGQSMRDHDPLGTLNFKEVIAKSSNIATSEVAMRIKPEIFYQYARNLGFGTPTNIDLPGELGGRLQRPYEWSKVTLPWMSIGYEVQATPVQILQAYAAFANKGMMMRPYVVHSVTDEYGNVKEQNRPKSVRRIAKKETIDQLMPIFEDVVSDSGTAGWASVEGLRIAGKTGTAQKYIDGRYRTRYRASFVGFFPVEDPKYVMLILLDEPKTSMYGGFTAGSIFKEVATRIAGLDNTIQRKLPAGAIAESTGKVSPRVEGLSADEAKLFLNRNRIAYKTTGSGLQVVQQEPAPGTELSDGEWIELKLGSSEKDSIPDGFAEIPDVTTMNMRQATTVLLSRGLTIETIGSGTIYTQFPRAGDLMRKGRTVTVRGKARSMQTISTIAAN
jgi:cell division protein FtsI (penicillin-binding protein 3)